MIRWKNMISKVPIFVIISRVLEYICLGCAKLNLREIFQYPGCAKICPRENFQISRSQSARKFVRAKIYTNKVLPISCPDQIQRVRRNPTELVDEIRPSPIHRNFFLKILFPARIYYISKSNRIRLWRVRGGFNALGVVGWWMESFQLTEVWVVGESVVAVTDVKCEDVLRSIHRPSLMPMRGDRWSRHDYCHVICHVVCHVISHVVNSIGMKCKMYVPPSDSHNFNTCWVFCICSLKPEGKKSDLKVENFACTNFRENKISRGLIFVIELFIFYVITFFREFRDHCHFLI